MSFATGRDFGGELCKALGLEPDKVKRIQVDVEAGEVAIVRVWEFVPDKEAKCLVETCTKYELCPLKDE